MKLDEMRYFVEIVDAGSICEASRSLFISQPSLTRTVSALEQELGLQLLERTKQGSTPTLAGKAVYDDCVRILGLVGDCERHWKTLAYEEKKDEDPITIPVIALPMICNSTMNMALVEVRKKYPRIHTRLFEAQLDKILSKTASEPFSIALGHFNEETKAEIYAFAKQHDLQIVPLFDDEYRFFAGATNPLLQKDTITQEDLKHYTIASYSNEDTETDHNFIQAGLSGLDKMFGNVIYLSNRYEMMNIAAGSDQIVTLAAMRMTRDYSFRQNHALKPLSLPFLHLPMTYFILYAKQPTIEEALTVGVLQSFFQSL
ncbi:MAG: LysR family transcriptional regulator [Peptococcaceae bacterium]|nr:LysR family transcriptional regulator [Peptococcaceae bacterium]